VLAAAGHGRMGPVEVDATIRAMIRRSGRRARSAPRSRSVTCAGSIPDVALRVRHGT